MLWPYALAVSLLLLPHPWANLARWKRAQMAVYVDTVHEIGEFFARGGAVVVPYEIDIILSGLDAAIFLRYNTPIKY